jgi:hypothetical protein
MTQNKRKKKINDLTGMKFDWITVVKNVGNDPEKHVNLYLCKCKCGNEFVKSSSEIRRLSCCYNCRNKKRSWDKNKKYIGQNFGKLKIIDIYFNNKGLIAQTLCECGNKKDYRLSDIKKGVRTNCGCENIGQVDYANKNGEWKGGNFLPYREANFKYIFDKYIQRADKANIQFELSIDVFKNLVQKNCFYCNAEPKKRMAGKRNFNGYFLSNGLDRIDNDKGYTENNVVPCCSNCNFMRHSMSQQDFLSWVARVYNHSVKGKKNV